MSSKLRDILTALEAHHALQQQQPQVSGDRDDQDRTQPLRFRYDPTHKHIVANASSSVMAKVNLPVLLKALHDFLDLVGMEQPGDVVADIIAFVLVNGDTNRHMLHMLITGPPGVGKSTLALCIAHILDSLGILRTGTGEAAGTTKPGAADGGTAPKPSSGLTLDKLNSFLQAAVEHDRQAELRKIKHSLRDTELALQKIHPQIDNMIHFLQREQFMPYPPYSQRQTLQGYHTTAADQVAMQQHPPHTAQQPWHAFCDPTGPCKFQLLGNMLANLRTDINGLELKAAKSQMQLDEVAQSLVDAERMLDPALFRVEKAPEKEKPKKPTKYMLASRQDFVAEYMGQSAIKTRKLLETMRGGVLAIDEAYSLLQGERDEYGKEVLAVLTQEMTENPDALILILIGYRDLIHDTVLRGNPGLKRRLWEINVPAYTSKELAAIFRHQVARDPMWVVSADIDLELFFDQRAREFPHFGGDTERLLLQCKYAFSRVHWLGYFKGDMMAIDQKIIDADILDKGYAGYIARRESVQEHAHLAHPSFLVIPGFEEGTAVNGITGFVPPEDRTSVIAPCQPCDPTACPSESRTLVVHRIRDDHACPSPFEDWLKSKKFGRLDIQVTNCGKTSTFCYEGYACKLERPTLRECMKGQATETLTVRLQDPSAIPAPHVAPRTIDVQDHGGFLTFSFKVQGGTHDEAVMSLRNVMPYEHQDWTIIRGPAPGYLPATYTSPDAQFFSAMLVIPSADKEAYYEVLRSECKAQLVFTDRVCETTENLKLHYCPADTPCQDWLDRIKYAAHYNKVLANDQFAQQVGGYVQHLSDLMEKLIESFSQHAADADDCSTDHASYIQTLTDVKTRIDTLSNLCPSQSPDQVEDCVTDCVRAPPEATTREEYMRNLCACEYESQFFAEYREKLAHLKNEHIHSSPCNDAFFEVMQSIFGNDANVTDLETHFGFWSTSITKTCFAIACCESDLNVSTTSKASDEVQNQAQAFFTRLATLNTGLVTLQNDANTVCEATTYEDADKAFTAFKTAYYDWCVNFDIAKEEVDIMRDEWAQITDLSHDFERFTKLKERTDIGYNGYVIPMDLLDEFKCIVMNCEKYACHHDLSETTVGQVNAVFKCLCAQKLSLLDVQCTLQARVNARQLAAAGSNCDIPECQFPENVFDPCACQPQA